MLGFDATYDIAGAMLGKECSMPTSSDLLPLAAAIAGLRSQIREAAVAASSLPPSERFRIVEAELELQVAAEDSATAEG